MSSSITEEKEILVKCDFNNKITKLIYPVSILNTKCDYFEALKLSNIPDVINLSLNPICVIVILDYLLDRILKNTPKDIRKDMIDAIRYLGCNELIKKYSIDVSDLYILTEEDKKIRDDEMKLRKDLKRLDNGEDIKINDKDLIIDDHVFPKGDGRCMEKNCNVLCVERDFPDNWSFRYCDHHQKENKSSYPTIGGMDGQKYYKNIIGVIQRKIGIKNFHNFDMGCFVIAGGFISKHIMCDEWSNISDVDFFLVCDSQEKAISEIRRFDKFIKGKIATRLLVATKNCITYVTKRVKKEKSKLNIQIILRLYKNITQIISGFDIDSCCCAFDGKHFYGMPRFIRAITNGYNIVDPKRQSRNYAQRLIKYKDRGFAICLPGYDADRLNPLIYTAGYKVTGMANILRQCKFSEREKNPVSDYDGGIYSLNNISYIKRHIIRFEKAKKSIPFLFGDNIRDILNPQKKCESMLIDADPIEHDLKEIEFVTKDPASQVGNSFFPVQDEWYLDAYDLKELKVDITNK